MKDGLKNTGYYIFWFNKSDWMNFIWCRSSEEGCSEMEDQEFIVTQANVYLLISIVLNWIYTPDIDGFIDILHFVFNCLMYPIIFFVVALCTFDVIVWPIEKVYEDSSLTWSNFSPSQLTEPWNDFSLVQTENKLIEKYSRFTIQIYTLIYIALFYRFIFSKKEFWKNIDHCISRKERKIDETITSSIQTDEVSQELTEAKYQTKSMKNSFFNKALIVTAVIALAFFLSFVSYYFLNKYHFSLFPAFSKLLEQFSIGLYYAFYWPFEKYTFLSWVSFSAYYLVYLALTFLAACFGLLLC